VLDATLRIAQELGRAASLFKLEQPAVLKTAVFAARSGRDPAARLQGVRSCTHER
jgi:hypothetical protein